MFCAVESKGLHFTFVTPDRSGIEFAQAEGRPRAGARACRNEGPYANSTSTVFFAASIPVILKLTI